jgi:hypothetical protein
MLDFTNSCDHGALVEEDNKLEGVVGCFVALSSASHQLLMETFMCR